MNIKKANTNLEILGTKIGLDHPTYFIADIAANHDGDLNRARDLIWLAAESGADERSIMAMTGHKTTQMVRRYIKEANIFKNNALNKIKL